MSARSWTRTGVWAWCRFGASAPTGWITPPNWTASGSASPSSTTRKARAIPPYWHARDYGLFALNPFGRNAFDPKQEESVWKLPAGQKVVFLWRVAIRPGDAQTGRVAEMYKEYEIGRAHV